jgi:biopolymer transport protein ExbD
VRIRDPEDLGEPEFSMAPLIDIVFQLLIFFMLATTYDKAAKEERELGIELPAAASAQEPVAVPDELVIGVFRDGKLSLSGRAVERAELESALASAARSNASLPVTIRGDRLVHHEDVVSVIDACGLAGLTNVAVGTLER